MEIIQEIRPMNIRPLHDRVIVERQEVESKSAGENGLTTGSFSAWKINAVQF